MLRIRLITSSDIDFVREIEHRFFNPISKEDFIKYYVDNSLYQIYIFVIHEEAIGYCILWSDMDKAQIYSMYIKENFRQKAYAYRALNIIEEKLKKQGIDEWTLEVRVSNDSAIGLYKKMGFEAVYEKKAYYANGEDALYMYKNLGSE